MIHGNLPTNIPQYIEAWCRNCSRLTRYRCANINYGVCHGIEPLTIHAWKSSRGVVSVWICTECNKNVVTMTEPERKKVAR